MKRACLITVKRETQKKKKGIRERLRKVEKDFHPPQ